jgi:hypothetical protein
VLLGSSSSRAHVVGFDALLCAVTMLHVCNSQYGDWFRVACMQPLYPSDVPPAHAVHGHVMLCLIQKQPPVAPCQGSHSFQLALAWTVWQQAGLQPQ